MLKLFFMIISMLMINMYYNFLLFQNMLFIIFIFYLSLIPNMYLLNISYNFSIDNLSFNLILLSVWIFSLMLMMSMKIFKFRYFQYLYLMLMLLLLMLLMLLFMSLSLMSFYLFFEGSLIPILFLILGWGYQSDRIQAGMYMLFYMLFASFPLLLGIIYIYYFQGSIIFILMDMNMVYLKNMNLYLYMLMILAFLVKMPMYLVHLWLPKAHVEAPVSGSMILASILLKLGGYGLLRMMNYFNFMNLKFSILWVSISLIGGLLISLNCLYQIDIKSLIAYSSISHMSVILSSLFTMFYWGINSSFCMMLAHGLCSSGLFCLVSFFYDRLGSRSLMINKGMLNFFPSLTFWWFLFCSMNMAAPPSLNMLSELSLLNSILSWSWVSMMFLMFIFFFNMGYSLYLFSFSQHGLIYSGLFCYSFNFIKEYLLLLLHLFPLNFFILKSSLSFIWTI